ncbi:hypothetical protein [Aneurinibacillus aneurinilyticus]|uniref:hypothetical protein n=1 Tax=Aneurinibacillus aneurinilyticus TaxID=1391 RepID=UPI00352402CF
MESQKYEHNWTEEETKAWHHWNMEWIKKDLQGLTCKDVPDEAILNQRYIFTPNYAKKRKVSGQAIFLNIVHEVDLAMKAVSIEHATIFSTECVQNINSFYTCVNVTREEDADVFYSVYLTFDFEANFDTYEGAETFLRYPKFGECEIIVKYADDSIDKFELDDCTINIYQEDVVA